jgi:membrane-bound metal-dependent hydrolase YbcI (DUF457 family)
MDTVTATLLGATAGRAAFHRSAGTAGVLVFAAGGLVPDLDALFAGDTLGFIRLHRGPTHSVVGAVVLGAGYAGVARLLRTRASFGLLFGIGVLGNLLIGIGTDLLTWWGTQVGWPFTDARLGVGVVFIVDLWLFAIASAPWLLWLVRRARCKPPPRAAWRTATVLALLYVGLCFSMRQVAFGVLEQECRARGGRPVDVLPQPLSPFHWNLVAEADGAWRLSYTDLLTLGRIWEERVVPKGDGPAAKVTDATATGRTLLWFYRLPHRAERDREDGRTEVIYADAAYTTFLPISRATPFRYRFVVEEGRVVEEGWVGGPTDLPSPSFRRAAPAPAQGSAPRGGATPAALVGAWRHTSVVNLGDTNLVTDTHLEFAPDGTFTTWSRSEGAMSRRDPPERGAWRVEGDQLMVRPEAGGNWATFGRYATTDTHLTITRPDGEKRVYERR